MVQALSACDKGRQWQGALRWFAEMRKQGLQANVIPYSATINACGKAGSGSAP